MAESVIMFDDAAARDRRRAGGKAATLAQLAAADFDVPPFFVVTGAAPEAGLTRDLSARIHALVHRLCPDGEQLAVRSSAGDEDGASHSFAGQFDTYLNVPADDVTQRVLDVWRSYRGERAAAYRRARGLAASSAQPASMSTAASAPAVIVQRMVQAEASGVAFAADPVTGRRGVVVVSAVRGPGESLVSGATDADTFGIDRGGAITERRFAAGGAGTGTNGAALSDEQAIQVAALARRASEHLGAPQDVEWAIEDGRIHLLQSRPITALSALADPDGVAYLWDNANIAESYSGVTTPLTFTFARAAYEGVYRQFVKIMRVPSGAIDDNANVFRHMLGLMRGRVYYNLGNWYRLLAMLPGFRANRRFMEQMMGVRQGLPANLAAELDSATWSGRLRDRLRFGRTILSLVGHGARLKYTIARFDRSVDDALAPGDVPLEQMRLDELIEQYHRLERRLLTRWDAPLINDFLTMIFVGVLRTLTRKWCAAGDDHSLCNDLVGGSGDMISAEPARRIVQMANLVSSDSAAIAALCDGDCLEALRVVRARPALGGLYNAYLECFSDRCPQELKLESVTLADDPLPLLRSIGRMARRQSRGDSLDSGAGRRRRVEAERCAAGALRRRPVQRALFQFVLRRARMHVHQRESLRLQRTRVFGRVRRIFVQVGRRLAAEGRLDEPRDVFYLDIDEVLGFVEGVITCTDLRRLAAVRKAEYERYDERSVPANRFETRGAVHVGNTFDDAGEVGDVATTTSGEGTLHGMGCCPGVVRGRVEMVLDPRRARPHDDAILVAQRTDPGWVMLLPSAAGLLVERGSTLSHSAVLARELGVPTIVAIPGLMSRLRNGQWVEMDGRSGLVRILSDESAPSAPLSPVSPASAASPASQTSPPVQCGAADQRAGAEPSFSASRRSAG